MDVPNESSFQGLFKMCTLSLRSIPETEKNTLKLPESLSENYTGNTLKSGNFCNFISPLFFEPDSAALLLPETAVIANWVIILVEAFLTPLLATVLELAEQSVPP